jgi:eukaryotic-like serine/threonine-protein kinase
MGCLDENTVVEFVEGGLSSERRTEVQDHLAVCGPCRKLVARTAEALLQTAAVSGRASKPDLSLLPLRGLRHGDKVGRYEVLHRVGEGAMGVVYAAEDTSLRRKVALKLLRAQPGHLDLEARLLREARAASVIRHPNIVPVHDVLELDDGSPVLVMDLLVGEPLRERLEREGRLSLSTTTSILIPVVSALEAAHALGVVHRDLKPDNIFLSTTDAGTLDVKIVDFGVAKLTAIDGPAAKTAGLTDTGALVGTPYYMAPEQAFGEKDLDPRADLWAVGIIFYECLTGSRPTEASNVGQVLKLLAHLSFPNIREVKPDVPESAAALVDALLCERERRVQTAGELRERLESLASQSSEVLNATAHAPGPDVTLRGATTESTAPPTSGRSAALAIGVLLVAGVGIATAFGVGRSESVDMMVGSAFSASTSATAPLLVAPSASSVRPGSPPVPGGSAGPSASAPIKSPPRATRRPKAPPSPSVPGIFDDVPAKPPASASQPGDGPAKLLTTPPF